MLRRFALTCLMVIASAPAVHAEETSGDEDLLKKAGIATDTDGLLAYVRTLSPTEADRKTVAELVKQLGHDEFIRREYASRKLAAWGMPALEALRVATKDSDVEVAHRATACIKQIESGPGPLLPIAATRLLAARKVSTATPLLLTYLAHTGDAAVHEAVFAAVAALAARPGKPDAALTAAIKDALPLRRAAAGHALGRSSTAAHRVSVAPLLNDKDPFVRFKTAEGMLAAHDRAAVPPLIELSLEPSADLGWRVEELLLHLAGETDLNLPSGDEPADRQKRREVWSKWWKEQGDKVDLARLDTVPAFLNRTLVPDMHANKVWEYDREGKVLWEITADLQCPIDAQVLPNGRVLVAELNGKRVTERDRAGKIVWQKDIPTPIACQRLPNGNTFIGTNHSLIVVDNAGKEVWNYKAPGGFFIHSVQRLRTGNYAMVSMGGAVTEIDAAGKQVRSFTLPGGGSWSGIEGVAGNRYLVVNNGTGDVLEVEADGKKIWEYKSPGATYASRLPNGNTLVVNSASGILEVDKNGKTVSQSKPIRQLWRGHRR